MMLRKLINKIIFFIKKPKQFPENEVLIELFSSFSKCYILGSSPTINQFDLTKLEEDSMKISMGNFYEHPDIEIIKPTIHLFAASHPPITEKVLTDWWVRCNEILPKNTLLLIERRDREVAKKVFVDRKVYYYSYGGGLPIDFTKKIISPWSVTIVALQLAIYSKVKEINLLGINHDWQCVKPYGHFYDHSKPCLEYYLKKENITINYEVQKQPFPKERLYREYELYQQYETLLLEAKKNNANIYNSDKYSDFDVFPFKNAFSN
ncbi:hypothetical protein [Polaribacter staleyi]|uniref:hypothetical protein n=1 Tax=Polaribacter staleyi TaxID=2022337 RepID=UPI0031BB3E75